MVGGNSLVELVGLGEAVAVDRLTVTWPTSKVVQNFRDLKGDQSIEVTEGTDAFKVLPRRPLPQPKP